MAVPCRDPRMNADRIYDYEMYLKAREEFPGRKKVKSWYLYIPPVRLQYKLGLAAGLFVMVASLGLMAFFSADTARLAYAKQELNTSLGALEQSRAEALGEMVEVENALYAGEIDTSAEVTYPGTKRYLVLTNIPEANGKRIVEELYPLSRRIIRLDP